MANRIRLLACAGLVAAQALVFAQGGDVNAVLTGAREALGGDKKLDAVKTLTMAGRSLRTNPTGTSTESEFEVAIELPDKYFRRDAVVNMGTMSIYRTSGFNGDGVISENGHASTACSSLAACDTATRRTSVTGGTCRRV